jgi:iron complex outermembrane receptor protein
MPLGVLAAGTAVADPAASASAAAATEATSPADSESLGEVVVTARKREESSLKIPVAVTALSSQELQAENVQSIDEIAAVTPGLVRDSTGTGAARADRSAQQLIIRGMTPASGNNVTSVFVNGIPVSDGDVDGIFDFDNVEVLKGPQSAYFGRSTFAGAINIVTKDPGNEWHGYASALGASGDYYDVKGAFEGPIVPDVITFRATARYYTRNGSWDNEAEPGQKLGDQETKSGSLQINIKPIQDLTIKLFGVYWEDNDGLGPTGLVQPSQGNCHFPSGVSANGQPFSGGEYYCGTLPNLLPGQPSARTTYTSEDAAMLGATGDLLAPNYLSRWGLKRDAYHLSSNIDYTIPSLGITLSSLTGGTNDAWGTFFPLNGIASQVPNVFDPANGEAYTDWPFIIEQRNEDFSQEFRVASDKDQRFRYTIGTSYLFTRAQTASQSNLFLGGVTPPSIFQPDESTTWGAFFGLAFDLTSQLTLDFDARYQSDRVYELPLPGESGFESVFHNFIPRVSLEYKPMPDVLAYFTYSKGVNPPPAVNGLAGLSGAELLSAESQGAKAAINPEYLDNYEIGLKGKFLDDRLVVSADAYYDIWTDKILSQDFTDMKADGEVDYLQLYSNLGKVVLPGFEVEITAKPIDSLVLNVSGAVNGSRIDSGECAECRDLRGATNGNVNGNQLPNYSKYSAQASGEYTQPFPLMPSFKWYQRTEVTYKSGQYVYYDNLAISPAQTNVNFRLGLNGDLHGQKVNVEAFVTNAFNNKAYTSLLNDWNLSNPGDVFGLFGGNFGFDSVYVGLPYLRTYGLRVRYDF